MRRHSLRGALVVVASASLVGAEEFTISRYRELIADYRATRYVAATDQLLALDHALLSARNNELPSVVDVARPSERKELIAAVVLHAEAAVRASSPGVSNFFLDEAVELTLPLGREQASEIQRKFHLAVSHSFFWQLRIADAIGVLQSAAEHFTADTVTQYGFGTLTELKGWLDNSTILLARARLAYERVLVVEPDHARARMRLGRVMLLLRHPDVAISHLEPALAALAAGENDTHRAIGLLSLGKAFHSQGDDEKARDSYRRALEVDPNCQAAAVALSHALRQLGQVDESRSVIREALDDTQRRTDVDSWMLYRLGESGRHRELWQELRSEYQ